MPPQPLLSEQAGFSKHLFLQGYPLWSPDPELLPRAQQRVGLRIGDVGTVDERGRFDVFFNILESNPGSPDSRTNLPSIGDDDIRCVGGDLLPREVVSSPETPWDVDPIDMSTVGDVSRRTTEYSATLCNDGAHVILPQGAQSFELGLHHRRLFENCAREHGADWLERFRDRLGWPRSNSLYLLTGFYKTCSWSIASFSMQTAANTNPVGVHCTLVEVDERVVRQESVWHPAGRFKRKIGPPLDRQGQNNQTIFIRGITVTPNLSPQGQSGQREPGFLSMLFSPSRFLDSVMGDSAKPAATETSKSNVIIQHVPQISQTSHPSEIINRYLLTKEPSAKIAVAHDSQWIAMLQSLEEGRAWTLEDLENRLEVLIPARYSIVTDNDAVYLKEVSLSSFTDIEHIGMPSDEYVTAEGPLTHTTDSPSGYTTLHPRLAQRNTMTSYLRYIFGGYSRDSSPSREQSSKSHWRSRSQPTPNYIYANAGSSSGGPTSPPRLKTERSNSYSARITNPSPLRYNAFDTATQASGSSGEVKHGTTSPKVERAPLYRRASYKSSEHLAQYAMPHTPSTMPSLSFGPSSRTKSSSSLHPGSAPPGSSVGSSSHHVRYERPLRHNPPWQGSVSSVTGSMHSYTGSAEHKMPHHPASLHMHPLFASTRLHSAPISYDVTYAPSSRTVLDRTTHTAVPAHTLAQPATDPPTPAASRLVLRSDKFPWPVIVGPSTSSPSGAGFYVGGSSSKSGRSSNITNLDLLYSLHTTLLTRVTPQEWEALGHGSRAQRKVTRAYEKRCTKMGGGWEGGVRRLDWLHSKTRLVGIEVEKHSNGHCTGKLIFGKA